jgi:DNA-binding NtrC family response regulator
MHRIDILIISADRKFIGDLTAILRKKSYHSFGVYTGQKGLELAYHNAFNLIILDLLLPDIDSLELLQKLKGSRLSAPLIVAGDDRQSGQAAEAIKLGAFEFIGKGTKPEFLLNTIQISLNQNNLEQNFKNFKRAISDDYSPVGSSRIMEQLREKIERVALSSARLMFIGDAGSGKKTAARYAHYCSARAIKPFMSVNCASASPEFPDSYLKLETELCGYKKGAFVGAASNKKGKFELANGGTLYLQEVGKLSNDLQGKLLRTIESNSVQPIGAVNEIKADVRIMSGTRFPLESDVKTGQFREDLYFRLNIMPVTIPPLVAHLEDIPLLARHFLNRAGFINKRVDQKGIDFLQSQTWIENIRELKEVIEKAALIAAGETISVPEIQSAFADNHKIPQQTDKLTGLFRRDVPLKRQLADLEKELLREVYNLCDGNITRAAKMLITDRGNLSKKLKKLGITGN